MTAELAPTNGTNGAHKEEDEKVPQNHVDGEEDGEDGEEDGAPEAAGTGAVLKFAV